VGARRRAGAVFPPFWSSSAAQASGIAPCWDLHCTVALWTRRSRLVTAAQDEESEILCCHLQTVIEPTIIPRIAMRRRLVPVAGGIALVTAAARPRGPAPSRVGPTPQKQRPATPP